MDTTTYNLVTIILGLFTVFLGVVTVILWKITLMAGLATVIIYYKQLKVMDTSIIAQNLAWLIQYLQASDVRHARFVVMTDLSTKSLIDWAPEEREEAATACAAYGVAGVYIELNRVDKDTIIINWGPSIVKECEICKEFIEEQRKKSGPRYWSALIWLYEEAIEELNSGLGLQTG